MEHAHSPIPFCFNARLCAGTAHTWRGAVKRNWKPFFYVANYFVRPVHFSIKYANAQRGGHHDVILHQLTRCPGMSCSGSQGNFGPIKAPRTSAVKPRGLCYRTN